MGLVSTIRNNKPKAASFLRSKITIEESQYALHYKLQTEQNSASKNFSATYATYILRPSLRLSDEDKTKLLQAIYPEGQIPLQPYACEGCEKCQYSKNCFENSKEDCLMMAISNKYLQAVIFILTNSSVDFFDATKKDKLEALLTLAVMHDDDNANLTQTLFNRFNLDVNYTHYLLHFAKTVMCIEFLVKKGANPFTRNPRLSALEYYVKQHQDAKNIKDNATAQNFLAKLKTALQFCPQDLLNTKTNQAQLKSILATCHSEDIGSVILPLILPSLQEQAVLEEKAFEAEKQRIRGLIDRYKTEIEKARQNKELIHYKHDKTRQETSFADLGNYVFSKLKQNQSFDEFAPRWLALIHLIMILQRNNNEAIKEIPRLIKIAKELTNKRSLSANFHDILNKLLPEYPKQSDIEKLKTQCEDYLQRLQQSNSALYNVLEPWINRKVFQAALQQQAAAASTPAEQKHQQAAVAHPAQQAAAAAPPASQKQKLDIDVTVHPHPVRSLNPGHELAQLRPAAVVQPEQNQPQPFQP